jgi:hypothetical protein
MSYWSAKLHHWQDEQCWLIVLFFIYIYTCYYFLILHTHSVMYMLNAARNVIFMPSIEIKSRNVRFHHCLDFLFINFIAIISFYFIFFSFRKCTDDLFKTGEHTLFLILFYCYNGYMVTTLLVFRKQFVNYIMSSFNSVKQWAIDKTNNVD